MRQKSFGILFSILGVVAAATLFAQTSPWPFPPRSGTNPSTTRSFTIAFWNIQWFPGGRPAAGQNEENRQIAAVHSDMMQLKTADVIGMEEVRDFAKAGLAVQKLPGFKVDVCANFPPREGQNEAQEVAVASRLQPLSAWAEMWKEAQPLTPPRGFAFAAYEVAPRQLLLVYGVHLKSNQGEMNENVSLRQESIRQLLSHMKAMEEAYAKMGTITWVLGGDFNTSLDDPRFADEKTIRSLMDSGFSWTWQNVPVASRTTLPPAKDFPPACFDHIFYRNATLRKAWVINTAPQSSDHRAIAATFDLPVAPK